MYQSENQRSMDCHKCLSSSLSSDFWRAPSLLKCFGAELSPGKKYRDGAQLEQAETSGPEVSRRDLVQRYKNRLSLKTMEESFSLRSPINRLDLSVTGSNPPTMIIRSLMNDLLAFAKVNGS